MFTPQIWEWLAYTTIVLEVVVLFISIALATKVRLAVAIVKVKPPRSRLILLAALSL